MIGFTCEHCGAAIWLPAMRTGRGNQCPKCGLLVSEPGQRTWICAQCGTSGRGPGRRRGSDAIEWLLWLLGVGYAIIRLLPSVAAATNEADLWWVVGLAGGLTLLICCLPAILYRAWRASAGAGVCGSCGGALIPASSPRGRQMLDHE